MKKGLSVETEMNKLFFILATMLLVSCSNSQEEAVLKTLTDMTPAEFNSLNGTCEEITCAVTKDNIRYFIQTSYGFASLEFVVVDLNNPQHYKRIIMPGYDYLFWKFKTGEQNNKKHKEENNKSSERDKIRGVEALGFMMVTLLNSIDASKFKCNKEGCFLLDSRLMITDSGKAGILMPNNDSFSYSCDAFVIILENIRKSKKNK